MSKNDIPVLKFMFRTDLKALNEALTISPSFEVQEINAANDLATFLSTVPAGLVIASLKDKNDLIQLASFVKLHKKVAKDTAVKIVIVNFSNDHAFDKAIAKLGIQDQLEPAINTKALKFKLDFWMKSLNAQIRNHPSAAQKAVKTAETNKQAENKKLEDTQTPVWLEPLDLEDDVWILKNPNDCKKVLNRWLVRMMGPSPYVGQWVDVKPNIWRFDIKESEKELYTPNPGAWFFVGDQKPDFIWKENLWLMTGDSFELLYKSGDQTSSRLKCKDKLISICKNSLFAKTKEHVIIESFDKELVFKKEAQNLEDMEGKNKTDQINNANLQGKNKTPADRSGNLSGKTEGEKAIQNSNLEMKTSTSSEKNFWEGHNEYENPEETNQEGAKQGPVKDGAQLAMDQKHQDVQKYYKNHNEAEKYEASEKEKNRPEREEEKAAAEKAAGSPSKNKDSASKNAREAQEAESNGDLGGKSHTDHLKSHYGAKEKGEKEEAPKGEGAEIAGKSHTDKLKSHYGAKEKGEKESAPENTDEYAGGSSTDKLKKHYGGKVSSEKEEKEAKEKASAENADHEANSKKSRGKSESEAYQKEEKKPGSGRDAKDWYPSANEEEESSASGEDELSIERKAKARKEKQDDFESASPSDFKSKAAGTDQIDGFYGQKKKSSGSSTEIDFEDEEAIASKKTRNPNDKGYTPEEKRSRGNSAENSADILPLDKAREQKNRARAEEERALEELTAEAKVVCFLIQDDLKISCRIDDFFDDQIIFHTEDQNVKASQFVKLDMMFKFMKKDTNLKMDGNVLAVDSDGEGNHFVTVNISEQNVTAFDSFMKLFQSKQSNVTEFLKRVKGL